VAAHRRSIPPHFHSELATALVRSTVEAADQAMRAHIRYGMDEVIEAVHPSGAENGWRMPRKSSLRGIVAGNSRHSF